MKFPGARLVAPALLLRAAAATATAVPPRRPGMRRRARAGGRLAVVGNGGRPAAAFPLAACQGDCDDDAECQEGLVCFQREAGGPNPPGCAGDPHNDRGEDNGNDFCYAPPAPAAEDNLFDAVVDGTAESVGTGGSEDNLFAPQELAVVGNNGRGATFPLGACQGDCDDDDECQEGLACFHRDGGDPVPPGCFGSPNHRGGEVDNGNDFCYDPAAEAWPGPAAEPALARDAGAPADEEPEPVAEATANEAPAPVAETTAVPPATTAAKGATEGSPAAATTAAPAAAAPAEDAAAATTEAPADAGLAEDGAEARADAEPAEADPAPAEDAAEDGAEDAAEEDPAATEEGAEGASEPAAAGPEEVDAAAEARRQAILGGGADGDAAEAETALALRPQTAARSSSATRCLSYAAAVSSVAAGGLLWLL